MWPRKTDRAAARPSPVTDLQLNNLMSRCGAIGDERDRRPVADEGSARSGSDLPIGERAPRATAEA